MNKKVNEEADAHYLSEEEFLFMKKYVDTLIDAIKEIKVNSGLQGDWALSDDCHWLIKIKKES